MTVEIAIHLTILTLSDDEDDKVTKKIASLK